MSTTARLSATVVVSPDQCQRVAELLRRTSIPAEDEQGDLESRLPDSVRANFFLMLVAICHQTSPVGMPKLEGDVGGKHRVGWDYLKARMHEVALRDSHWVDPQWWPHCTADDVTSAIGAVISEPERRAELIRDLGDRMSQIGWTTFEDAYRVSAARLGGDELAGVGPGLLDLLSEFEAYRDPVRKKSYFLLSILMAECGWTYADPENMLPPVDYHEVRGHLRLGTVRIEDEQLLRRVEHHEEVAEEDDVAIRQAVQTAISEIATLHGATTASRLHYLFWNVFRVQCVRVKPDCFGLYGSILPQSYAHLATLKVGKGCCFADICPNAGGTHPLEEHRIHTDFY